MMWSHWIPTIFFSNIFSHFFFLCHFVHHKYIYINIFDPSETLLSIFQKAKKNISPTKILLPRISINLKEY